MGADLRSPRRFSGPAMSSRLTVIGTAAGGKVIEVSLCVRRFAKCGGGGLTLVRNTVLLLAWQQESTVWASLI